MAARSSLLVLGTAAGLVLLSGVAVAAVPAEPGVPGAPSAPSAPTVTAPATVTLGTEAEAWYQLTRVDTCTSPAGCLPVAVPAVPELPELPAQPSVFPADTLHVAWAGGAELARSYLKLDRSSLPKGATVVAGTLRVPLIADPTAGTVLADTAGVKACLAAAPITDGVAGSLSAAPAMDCAASNPLVLEGDHYTVDLAPFLAAWAAGTPDEGLALTPFSSSSATSAWALAVPGKEASGLPHVEADLSYVVADAAARPAVVPAAPAPVAQPVQAPVQSSVTGAVPVAQVPVQAVRKPQQTLLSAGTSPLGWVVLGLGVLGVLVLGLVASQPADRRA